MDQLISCYHQVILQILLPSLGWTWKDLREFSASSLAVAAMKWPEFSLRWLSETCQVSVKNSFSQGRTLLLQDLWGSELKSCSCGRFRQWLSHQWVSSDNQAFGGEGFPEKHKSDKNPALVVVWYPTLCNKGKNILTLKGADNMPHSGLMYSVF